MSPDLTAILLSRIQFALTVSFHIIFPAFTIGLAAWLAVLEAMHLWTGRNVYARLFAFWLKIFAVAFGLGVVSGIVMAFQFGSNWSELSRRSGPIQGPLLAYESFTAFALEASFFGVLIFGRGKVPPVVYLASAVLVALGTSFSSFWILVNNSWMQWPTGFAMTPDGVFEPTNWSQIIFNGVVWARFPHMMLAAYVTTAFCVAATGAWHLLRGAHREDALVMLRMGLGLAAVLVPAQIVFGHLNGDYVVRLQPSKIAAIEGRWENQQPAGEVIFAIPDEETESNRFELSLPPPFGSLIDSSSLTSKEIGIKSIPTQDRPPILIPFVAFRIMVGIAMLMLVLAWGGTWFAWRHQLRLRRWFLWPVLLSFPLGFVATLTGWITAEVGRQPWTVYGQLRTVEAVTPTLRTHEVAISLIVFCSVYALIFVFGAYYIYRLLRAGPGPVSAAPVGAANPKRPLAVPGGSPQPGAALADPRGVTAMVEFWAAALALALLLYVLLDGFDLGIGMLFPFAPDEQARRQMLSAISPVWDGNETWLVLAATILFGAFPLVYSIAISAFYLPVLLMLVSLILRGVAFEFRYKAGPLMRRVWDAGFVGGSTLATFMQGTTVGAFVAELPVANGRFVGDPLFWLQPLALTCGVGLCIGYALAGACWLIGKTDGAARRFGYRVLPRLTAALFAFLAVSFVISLLRHLQVMDRWVERPVLGVFPAIGLLAGAGLFVAWRRRRDAWLFPCVAAIFASAFGTLAASFLPYMVPFSITLRQAAAPPSSLGFMFWGAGVIVLPLTLAYTAGVYFVFRGRVTEDAYEESADQPRSAIPTLQHPV